MERPGQPLRTRWRLVKSRALIAASASSIVVGRNLADDRAFAPGIASGKVVLIRNGIDRAPARAASDAPVPAPMAGPDPVILAVGRLHPQENFEGLIDAVGYANRVRPLKLVVLGSGDPAYRDALLARARAQEIGDRVVFAGVTSDVYPWLHAARAFAIASWWEGSSIALLEAIAAGVPIVASAMAGDAAEILEGGRYGLLVPPDDPAAFAAALLRQTGDHPVRPGDRAQAYDRAVMLDAYRDLLAAKASAPH